MHSKQTSLSPDLTLVFRALPGMYILLSPDYVILDATERYAEAANFKIGDVIGQNLFEMFPDNSDQYNIIAQHNLEVSLKHVLKHKESHTMPVIRFDVPLPKEQGGELEKRFWSTTNSPILNSKGEVAYILHETRDITASVLQDQTTQENEERLAMLTNALHTVAWEYDIPNDRLTWGASLYHVFGYQPDEMHPNGASWDKLVHTDDFESVQRSIAHATSTGQKIWTGEYRFKRADGSFANVLDQGYFQYDSQGIPLRTFGTIIDISQNRRTEENLKESDARFRQLLENLPHMAWTADAKGKVLYFNDNWYNYTGMPKGQTEGWVNVIHPDDTAYVLTTWHRAILTGKLYEIEYRIQDRIDGSYRTFLERSVPMYDEQGNIKLWVATFTDIEDQKQSLEEMRLKDQQLENILELSPAHLCMLEGPDHICRYVSPGVYSMYGNRPYLGTSAQDIWPEYLPLGFIDLLDQVYTQGDPAQLSEIEVMFDRYNNGNPQAAYFNFKYQPIYSNNSQPDGVLIAATEVTELVLAKRKIEELTLELKQKYSRTNY